jgi:hypothetical protein
MPYENDTYVVAAFLNRKDAELYVLALEADDPVSYIDDKSRPIRDNIYYVDEVTLWRE